MNFRSLRKILLTVWRAEKAAFVTCSPYRHSRELLSPMGALWFWWAFPSHSSSQPSPCSLPGLLHPFLSSLIFVSGAVNMITWIHCTNWSDYLEVTLIAEMLRIMGAWLDALGVVSEMCIHTTINELHCSLLIDLLSVLRLVCVGFWWHVTAVSSTELLPSPTLSCVVLVFWSTQAGAGMVKKLLSKVLQTRDAPA